MLLNILITKDGASWYLSFYNSEYANLEIENNKSHNRQPAYLKPKVFLFLQQLYTLITNRHVNKKQQHTSTRPRPRVTLLLGNNVKYTHSFIYTHTHFIMLTAFHLIHNQVCRTWVRRRLQRRRDLWRA
jgi:hypothetical protein